MQSVGGTKSAAPAAKDEATHPEYLKALPSVKVEETGNSPLNTTPFKPEAELVGLLTVIPSATDGVK